MTFTVRDLMLDVFPADEANAAAPWLCAAKAPPPQPQPKPDCTNITGGGTGGATGIEESLELANLAFLRQQLQQALHP